MLGIVDCFGQALAMTSLRLEWLCYARNDEKEVTIALLFAMTKRKSVYVKEFANF